MEIKCPYCSAINKVKVTTDHLEDPGDDEVVAWKCSGDDCGQPFVVRVVLRHDISITKANWEKITP